MNNGSWKSYIKVMLLKNYELLIKKPQNKHKKVLYIASAMTIFSDLNDLIANHTTNYTIGIDADLSLNEAECLELKLNANLLLLNIQQCNEWFKRGYIGFAEVLFVLFDDDLYESLVHQRNQAYTEFIDLLNASCHNIHYVGLSGLSIRNSIDSKQIDTNLSFIKNLFKNCWLETATDLLDTNNLLNNYKPNEIIDLYQDEKKVDPSETDGFIRSNENILNSCHGESMQHAIMSDQTWLAKISNLSNDINNLRENSLSIMNDALSYLHDMNLTGYKKSEEKSSDIEYIHLLCVSVLNECKYLLESVGIWCFGKSLSPFILQLDKLSQCLTNASSDETFELLILHYTSGQLRLLRELCIKELASLKTITTQHRNMYSSLLVQYFCTNKTKSMINFLKNYQHLNHTICAVVYVCNKQEATTLSLFLKKLSKEDTSLGYINPSYIVSNNNCDRNINMENQDHFKQEEIIRKFHSGEINLLVCTYEMEDSLDVPANCNLIIRLDSQYFNYDSYILSKTRLKSKISQILYVCQLKYFNKFFRIFKNCKNIENLFETKYSVLADYFKSVYSSNGASDYRDKDVFKTQLNFEITKENSLAILNRYCLRLPSDALTQLVPIFEVKQRTSNDPQNQYKCFLRMPINSALSQTIESGFCKTPYEAIKHSAYKANVELHKMKELNDNLDPITKELFFKVYSQHKTFA
jgi:hypothetical protein